MNLTRRRLLSATAGAAGAGLFTGCIDGTAEEDGSESGGPVVQASFFVFGDVTTRVAGDAADAELLVPVGQHGHGWEPGPNVREDVHGADLLVHGMEGFQPWVDAITADLEADGADVATVDVSSGVDLLEPSEGHDGHDSTEDTHDDHEHGDADPHFWMDPLRVKDAVDAVEAGLADVATDDADAYAANADDYTARLDDLHERIESTVSEASTGTLLVAGHDSFRYFADQYGIDVAALTNVSPDDRPTTRDIERAQEVIDEHDIRYVCADPLESQEAADQLVAETAAEAVLPLTAMPGLTDEWAREDWGYVDVVENVNLPTLERALGL